MCFWKILGVFSACIHAQFKSLALTPSYLYSGEGSGCVEGFIFLLVIGLQIYLV